MRILSTAFLSTLLFSSLAFAQPELVARASIDYGNYEKVMDLTVKGNIEKEVLSLAEEQTKNSDADYYVIEDIQEDIDRGLIVLKLSLYRDLSSSPFMANS